MNFFEKTTDMLEKMIEAGQFHNYGREYFDKVFDKIDEYRGACL